MAAKLILLCGPSGSGKKTIWSGIINRPKYNAIFSVSMTTRKARKGEKHGDDYFFVTKKQFETAIKKKQFLEHATYIDNYYGTPKAFVIDNLKKNKNVFLEIEMNGALQIMKNFSNKKIEGNKKITLGDFLGGKESALQCRGYRFNPWSGT